MEVIAGETRVYDVDATLDDIRETAAAHGVVAQAFDARCVAGREHLVLATRCALRAREHDDMIADDLAVEILCYTAGRRQIGEALAVGITPGKGPIVALVVDPERAASALGGQENDLDPAVDESAVADAMAEQLGLTRAGTDAADHALEATDAERLRTYFDISDAEREATDSPLAALVRERTALLAVTK